MNRIQKIFQNRTEKIIPFLTAGYPAKEDTLNMVLAAEKSGAAMVELGMPFSDPLADGPVIQQSSQQAHIQWTTAGGKQGTSIGITVQVIYVT